MYFSCIRSLHYLKDISDNLYSSQLYVGGYTIFFPRSTPNNMFASSTFVYTVTYGVTKCALPEICSPFVHYMKKSVAELSRIDLLPVYESYFAKMPLSYEMLNRISLVVSVQYMCPVVPLCIVDASLSHYVGN